MQQWSGVLQRQPGAALLRGGAALRCEQLQLGRQLGQLGCQLSDHRFHDGDVLIHHLPAADWNGAPFVLGASPVDVFIGAGIGCEEKSAARLGREEKGIPPGCWRTGKAPTTSSKSVRPWSSSTSHSRGCCRSGATGLDGRLTG